MSMRFHALGRFPVAVTLGMLAMTGAAHAGDFSGNAAATSDYVFRGISQSDGDPAVQLGLRVDMESGAYVAVWASNVRFPSAPDASTEVDGVLGWRGNLNEQWVGDVNLTRFQYPGTSSRLSYSELIATLTWRERNWILLGYSPDVFASGRYGIYAQLGTRVPLGSRSRIEISGGYYALDEAYGRSYAHAQIVAAWLPHPRVELRLTGHATDSRARVLFGDAGSARLEAAIQASF
jgi:uncharacterized protein (TIGR02001 family)